jgi:hypothetical protein
MLNNTKPKLTLAATGTSIITREDAKRTYWQETFAKYFGIKESFFTSASEDHSTNLTLTPYDILKEIYGSASLIGLNWKIQYASRDVPGKNHWMNPAKFDAFLIPKHGAITKYYSETADHAAIILEIISKRWTELGLPTKPTGVRNTPVPDTKTVIASPKLMAIFFRNYHECVHLVADADSLTRYTVQRYVRPFWYIRNMKANVVIQSQEDSKVLDAYLSGLSRLLYGSSDGANMLKQTASTTSDPIGTNSGWPVMSSSILGKMDSKKFLNSIMHPVKTSDPSKWNINDVENWAVALAIKSSKFTGIQNESVPFATMLTRRFKPNYKPIPGFNDEPNGVLSSALLGYPEQRVAFMFSYLHNLMTTPIMVHLKTSRKLVQGMYHDEDGKKRYSDILRRASQSGHFLIENDAGGFDTNISMHSFQIASSLISKHFKLPYSSDLNQQLMMGVRTNKLIIPDPASDTKNTGLLMINTPATGLQSGSKLTGEWGSLITKWLNLITYYQLGWMSMDDIVKHGATGTMPDPTRLQLIQGDDNTHIIKNAKEALELSNTLEKVYTSFGIKADIELSDRFLMRHVANADDSPVLGRIYQQRLSNEKAPDNYLVAAIGLGASLENVGNAIFKPSEDARQQVGMRRKSINKLFPHQRMIIDKIKDVFQTAYIQVPYHEEIIKAALSTSSSSSYNQSMNQLTSRLAKMQLNALDDLKRNDFINDLIIDQHSPSSAAILEMLKLSSSGLAQIIQSNELAGIALLKSTLDKAHIPIQ